MDMIYIEIGLVDSFLLIDVDKLDWLKKESFLTEDKKWTDKWSEKFQIIFFKHIIS